MPPHRAPLGGNLRVLASRRVSRETPAERVATVILADMRRTSKKRSLPLQGHIPAFGKCAALSTFRVLAGASRNGSCQTLEGRSGMGSSLPIKIQICTVFRAPARGGGGRKRGVRGKEPRSCQPGRIALDGRWRHFPDVACLGRRLEERSVPVFRGPFRRGKLTADSDTNMHIKLQT